MVDGSSVRYIVFDVDPLAKSWQSITVMNASGVPLGTTSTSDILHTFYHDFTLESGLDQNDADLQTILTAYQDTTQDVDVYYRSFTGDIFAETEAAHTAAVAADANTVLKAPLAWMLEQNWFYQQSLTVAPSTTEIKTSSLFLQQVKETKPATPPATALYTNEGVGGWGDNNVDLGDWHRPSASLAVGTDDVLWFASTSVGANENGTFTQTPWIVSPAVPGETILYNTIPSAAGAHAVRAAADLWYELRSADGKKAPWAPIHPITNLEPFVDGELVWSSEKTFISNDRLEFFPPPDLSQYKAMKWKFKGATNAAALSTGAFVQTETFWHSLDDVLVANFRQQAYGAIYSTFGEACFTVMISGPLGSRILVRHPYAPIAVSGADFTFTAAFLRDSGVTTGLTPTFIELIGVGNSVFGRLELWLRRA